MKTKKNKDGCNLILCPLCGGELEYDHYVGIADNGNAYHQYQCKCGFIGHIFKENIYESFKK